MSYRTRYSGGSMIVAQVADARRLVSGAYYTGHFNGVDTTVTVTQSVEHAIRFEVGNPVTIDRIGIEVTTNQANGLVRLGIRRDASGVPGDLLVDAETVDAASSTGFKELTISQALHPGRWWLCCAAQDAAGIVLRARLLDSFIGQSSTSTTNPASYAATGRTGAFPASFGTPTASTAGPKIMVRAA